MVTIGTEQIHIRETDQSRKRQVAVEGVLHVINGMVKGYTA